MDTIPLSINKQKELNNKVKAIKRGIKSQKVIKDNIQNAKRSRRQVSKARATIYLGHIPHGFYENEMTSYFSQFGQVISATLARSSKTGKSKGYGFVEFQDEDVAKIAAETMNNYLISNRILKCRYIPYSERKGKRLRVIDAKNYPRKINRLLDAKTKNLALQKLDDVTYKKKAQKKVEELRQFFKDKGIDFSFKVEESKNVKQPKKLRAEKAIESSKKAEDEYEILEIDESDNEIQFQTPPKVKKVFKKSVSIPNASKTRSCKKNGKKSEILSQPKKNNKSVKKKVIEEKSEKRKKLNKNALNSENKKDSVKWKLREKINVKKETIKNKIKTKQLTSKTKLEKKRENRKT